MAEIADFATAQFTAFLKAHQSARIHGAIVPRVLVPAL
jgi:hypothetical protein